MKKILLVTLFELLIVVSKIRKLLEKIILQLHTQDKPHGYISSISIGEAPKPGHNFYHTNKIKGTIMALTLTDSQQAVGTLTFVDKKGNPAQDLPDGSVTVSSSDENVATVTYDDPSNKITVVAGAPGVAALTIKATGRDGNDLPFEDTAIEVTAGDAVGGTIAFETPTEQV